MHRFLIAALAALTLGLVAPAAANAQGFPWMPTPLTPLPPNAEAHEWDGCMSGTGGCFSTPVGQISLLGGVDAIVRDELALPHWTANVAPLDQYSSNVGSSLSSGSPGNWDVYFWVYEVRPLTYGYKCLYHAHVAGSEWVPSVVQVSPPACSNLQLDLIPRPQAEGQ